MLFLKNTLPVLLLLLLSAGCDKPPADLNNEREAIRQLMLRERQSHFDRNTTAFAAGIADSIWTVKNGGVKHFSREEFWKKMEPYFSSVTFIRWDDLEKPVIQFSEDGSLAYAVVQKEVLLTYPDTNGQPFYDTTRYAWLAVYRKINGVWACEANASTSR